MATVNASETVTLTPIADTYIDSTYPDYNFGGDDDIYVMYYRSRTSSGAIIVPEYGVYIQPDPYYVPREPTRDKCLIYLKFDLSDLTTDSYSIESATLEMKPITVSIPGSYQYFIGVFSISNTDWNENEITWSNAPWAEEDSHEYIDEDITEDYDPYSWDITDTVKARQGNYLTLVLELNQYYHGQDRITYFHFKSKEAESGSPRLVINYEGGEPDGTTDSNLPTNGEPDGTSQSDSSTFILSPLLLVGAAVVIVVIIVVAVVAVILMKKKK
jgi:hypothetical protein